MARCFRFGPELLFWWLFLKNYSEKRSGISYRPFLKKSRWISPETWYCFSSMRYIRSA